MYYDPVSPPPPLSHARMRSDPPPPQAIQQGNSEGARICAQDAIREKNQVSEMQMNNAHKSARHALPIAISR